MSKLLQTCPVWRAPDGDTREDWFQLFDCFPLIPLHLFPPLNLFYFWSHPASYFTLNHQKGKGRLLCLRSMFPLALVPSPFSLSLSPTFNFLLQSAAKRRMAGSNFPKNCAMPASHTWLVWSVLSPGPWMNFSNSEEVLWMSNNICVSAP